MKLRSLLFPALLLSAVIPMGCDKDDEDQPGDSAALQNLYSSGWKISSATANGFNIPSNLIECYMDNVVTFYADRKGMVEESANVCDPSTAGDFTWTTDSTDTEITLSTGLLPGGNNTFKIVSVSSTTLVLSQVTNLIPAPVPVEATVTMVHP